MFYFDNKNISILMFVSSVFFLVGVNKILSPILFVFGIFFPVFLYQLFKNKSILKIQLFFISYIFIVFLVILSQKTFLYHKFGIINEVFRHIFWVFYGVVFLGFVVKLKNKEDFYFVINKSIFFITLIFIVEFLLRMYSGVKSGSLDFYSFKFNSILYPDSNFVALNLLIFYIFIDNFSNKIKYIKIYKNILLLLMFFCFSRTVYFLFILYFSVNFFKLYKTSYNVWLTRFLGCFLVILTFSIIYNNLLLYVQSDGSVNTKFEIFDGFLYVFSLDNYNPFIGLGSGNLIDYIGRESHNFWGLTAEMGGIWSVLIVLIFARLIFENNFFWVTLTILISSFTAILPITYMTLFFCLFLLTYVYNRLKA